MSDWKLDFKYGMLLVLPKDKVRNMVNKLRKQYDPESQRMCEGHITLTQPFLKEPRDESWQLIKEALRNFNPFEIYFGPIETFGNSPIVKFDIEPKDKLVVMRKMLHETGLFNLTLPFTDGFIPHMTISESGIESTEEALKIVAELNESIKTGSFRCDEVLYVRPDEVFHFEVAKSFVL